MANFLKRMEIAATPVPATLALFVFSLGASAVDERLTLLVLGGGFALLSWVHRSRPHHVLGFLFAAFCMAPLLRRIHDFLNGWTESNPILVAPYLILPMLMPGILQRLPWFRTPVLAASMPVVLTLAYGFSLGAILNGFAGAVIALLEWGVGPLLFVYLVQRREDLDASVLRNWVFGLALFESVYALVQFVQITPWDAHWLMSSKMYTSMGFPIPFQMRTFGTLNSAGPFAAFLTFYLLVGIGSRSFYVGGPLAVAALGTTMVRAGWVVVALGWFLALLLAPRGKRSGIALPIVAAVGLLVVGAAPFASRFESVLLRLQTFGSMESDNSFQDRTALLEVAKAAVFGNPAGAGLGSEGRAARYNKAGIAGIDNGFIALVWVMGWGGGFAYLLGVGLCFLRGVGNLGVMPVPIYSMGITALALFFFNLFGTAFSGLICMMFWSSLGFFAGWEPPRARGHAGGVADESTVGMRTYPPISIRLPP